MEASMKELADMIGEAVKAAMKPAEQAKDPSPLAAPSIQRGAEPDDTRTGVQKMAAFVRYLAAGKGDPEHGAKIAKGIGDPIHKNLMMTDFDAGGALVPADFIPNFYEALRPVSAIRRVGYTPIPLVNGSVTLPGVDTGATATYGAEAAATRASSLTTGDIRLTEKILTCIVPISNQLLRSPSASVNAVVQRDMLRAMGQAEDTNFINGDGTASKPTGIRNQMTSSHSTAGSSSSLTAALVEGDLTAMRKLVKAANVNIDAGVYLMNTDIEEDLMRARGSNDVRLFPEMDQGRLGAYAYVSSNNVPDGVIMFGNASDIILAESESIRVQMSDEAAYVDSSGNTQSAFSKDQTVMKLVTGHDIALRYRQSWAEKTAVDYDASNWA